MSSMGPGTGMMSPQLSAVSRMSSMGPSSLMVSPRQQPFDRAAPQFSPRRPMSALVSPAALPPLETDNLAMPLEPQTIKAPTAPPPLLSQQMVDPGSIAQQRLNFSKQLVVNLKEASIEIARNVQVDKQQRAQRAALEKANYDVIVDKFIQEQALAMDIQTNMDIMRLQQAAVAEKFRLEQQAVALKMEYEAKKAEEDALKRKFLIETEFLEQSSSLVQNASKLQSSMAAHGMQPSTRSPAEPIVPHLCPVPPVLADYWARYGYAAPSLAVPMEGYAT